MLGLQIRTVMAENMNSELNMIGSLLPLFPCITFDVEYAGTLHRSSAATRIAPSKQYALVKKNVDAVPIVMLGITLSNEYGNLPLTADGEGRLFQLAWEVTFSDFDPRRDRHAPESVTFLRSQGVCLDKARARGVSSAAFAAKLAAILSATPRPNELTWAAFGGAYDFAYMLKILTGGQPLPETWHEFMAQTHALLGGGRVFDAKYMAEHCERTDLGGLGLRRMAATLGMRCDFPELPFLAGRKSYIACFICTIMRRRILYRDGGDILVGLLDGIHW
ncbi:putative CCR4-associated factor 1 9 [Zea mays]|uniref:Putative CCR4-associated factor 1 9 n=1 Tax=Zea mays TaxID=4577 RepID=A0A3L6G1H9_MAIZE|nr:putative CCR4-associated factor 1 9 [Zea mays]